MNILKRYIKISRFEPKKSEGVYFLGSYIQPIEDILSAIDAELDDVNEQSIGAKIEFEIIKMEENDFKNLPEFGGY